jgi:hypothetical protein
VKDERDIILGPQGEPLELRYSEDQPRDDLGRFGSANDLSGEEQTAALARLSTLSADKQSDYAKAYNQDAVKLESLGMVNDGWAYTQHPASDINGERYSKLGDVPLSGIGFSASAQDATSVAGLKAYIARQPDPKKNGWPEVARTPDGKYHIISGHTRLGAVMLSGRATARARVYQYSQDGKWIRQKPSLRYSPDQPREDNGRFGSGSGMSKEDAATIQDWGYDKTQYGGLNKSAAFGELLDRVPDRFTGKVVRGTTMTELQVAQLKESKTLTLDQHTSATANENEDLAHIAAVESTSGRPGGNVPVVLDLRVLNQADVGEQLYGQSGMEVILKSGTSFSISRVSSASITDGDGNAHRGYRIVGAQVTRASRSFRYSPNQPRDDHGRFGDGAASPEMYHGTAAAHADSISTEGLLASKSTYTDSVFAASTKDEALKYALINTDAWAADNKPSFPGDTLERLKAESEWLQNTPVLLVTVASDKILSGSAKATLPPSEIIKMETFKYHDVWNYLHGNGDFPKGKTLKSVRTLRYSPDQPRDDHGRFGEGSNLQEGTAEHILASLSTGAGVDKMSYGENRAAIDKMAEAYKQGSYIKGAADVVSKYSEIDQPTGLATREIVSQALAGKTLEEIKADPKVQGLIADAQYHLAPGFVRFKEEDLKNLVEGAQGYYQAIRNAAPSTEPIYRGTASRATIKKEEFELRGPTAFSHSKDAAMTYANGTLIEVLPGAHMLPTKLLDAVKDAAGGDVHATAPAFYNRSDSVVHPLGSSYGYRIGFDTDRELTSSGRFRVVSQEKKLVTFTDTVSGKFRTRTVNYVKVEHVGAF